MSATTKLSGKHFATAAPVIAALLIVAIWSFGYHISEFKGGVGIRDSGVFSYPRYRAQLGVLPLWQDGEHRFDVRGLPPGPLDLQIYVEGATGADRAELTSLSTTVSATILDGFGTKVCSETGLLSDAKTRALPSWVLASSNSSASFWQESCLQLPINRSKAYTIKVSVSEVDPQSPHKMLMAVLSGGGVELP
jgi:hypothetical protein